MKKESDEKEAAFERHRQEFIENKVNYASNVVE